MKTTKMINSATGKTAIGFGLTTGLAVANAAFDGASVVTELGAAATTVGVIGAAALSIVVVVKVFKYIRSAF